MDRLPFATEGVLSEAGPPICGELVGPSLCEPVTGTEVGVPVATEHPTNTETIKSTTIRLRQ